MAEIDDFRTVIRDYLAHPEYSNLLIDSFIRQAETNLSRQLRVKEMIVIADAPITDKRVALPKMWRELEYVRFNNSRPLEYIHRNELFGRNCRKDEYTIVGDYILFGIDIEEPDGTAIEIAYFSSAPHLAAGSNWLYKHYYDIYLQSAVSAGFIYSVETDKAASLLSVVTGVITSANEEYLTSKISGSTLRRPNTRVRV